MASTRLRWGADAPADIDSARARLLDGAESCFSRFGVLKTTVEDVASAAQVSRATVYRYFSDRDEIILGVLLRHARRFLDRLLIELEGAPDFGTAIVDAVVFALAQVRSDEHLAMLFAPDVAGVTSAVAGASEAMFELTASFLRPFFDEASDQGALRVGLDTDDAVEWTVRVVLSLLTVDGPRVRDARDERRLLENFLVPAFAATKAGPPRRRPRRT